MASDEGLSRGESRAMRDMGRQAMSQVVGVALKQAVSHDLLRTFAVVSKVNGDGTVDLECGSDETPMPLDGVRLTLGCSTVEVGDTVVVDTYDHSPLVVAVLYSNASSGHTVASKPAVDAARSASGQALSEAKAAKAKADAAQAKADAAAKAASSHAHSASGITSGTLSADRLPTVPVSKGGTGATDAASAFRALSGYTLDVGTANAASARALVVGGSKLQHRAIAPVYRLYNKYDKCYYFTASLSEYNSLVSAGWTGQGTQFHAFG